MVNFVVFLEFLGILWFLFCFGFGFPKSVDFWYFLVSVFQGLLGIVVFWRFWVLGLLCVLGCYKTGFCRFLFWLCVFVSGISYMGLDLTVIVWLVEMACWMVVIFGIFGFAFCLLLVVLYFVVICLFCVVDRCWLCWFNNVVYN